MFAAVFVKILINSFTRKNVFGSKLFPLSKLLKLKNRKLLFDWLNRDVFVHNQRFKRICKTNIWSLQTTVITSARWFWSALFDAQSMIWSTLNVRGSSTFIEMRESWLQTNILQSVPPHFHFIKIHKSDDEPTFLLEIAFY